MTKRELYFIGSLLSELERSDDRIEALESLYNQLKIVHRSERRRRGLTQKEEEK